MKTKGAILWGAHKEWSVEEIDMGDPVEGEIRVRLSASGLCHSDEHLLTGDIPNEMWPILGGHEGAGIVEAVGPGPNRHKVGDHVVIALPGCGHCRPCRKGHQNVCDESWRMIGGPHIADDTYRVKTASGDDVSMMCLCGTFSPYTTINQMSAVQIPVEMPLDLAALLGCGVTAGWWAAQRVAEVQAGDTVAIAGIGGLGASALLSAVANGAEKIIAIDPKPFKREQALALGATHAYASMEEAFEPVQQETRGIMCDSVIVTIGENSGRYVQQAMNLTAKLGIVAQVGVAPVEETDAKLSVFELTAYNKQIRGSQLGGGTPQQDVLALVGLYLRGKLPLEKILTQRYSLEDINLGYQAMRDAENIRGLVEYTDADY